MKNVETNENLTPEQLETRREEMKDFYDKSIPYLESQAKYEKALTDIEESRYRRATMQIQYATMMSAAQSQEQESTSEQDYSSNDTVKPLSKVPNEGKKLKRE
jgi:hypothetical protein